MEKNDNYSDKKNQHREGFTLIEMMLVLVIIGLIVGMGAVAFGPRQRRAEILATRGTIRVIGGAIDMYHLDNGRYPASPQGLVTAEGWEQNWAGPYLQNGRIPLDAWSRDIAYSKTDIGYQLTSSGPDGQSGTSDDLTN